MLDTYLNNYWTHLSFKSNLVFISLVLVFILFIFYLITAVQIRS